MDNLQKLWSTLLSRDSGAVRKMWSDLDDDQTEAIADHLKHMLTDDTYSAEQKESARIALEAIQNSG